MASCPSCGGMLNFWNIKAECPHCGVNIPNYDWEGRLDEDAAKAEIAWSKFRIFTGNFKSALFGSKLRIIRFVCTFLPLVALVLPLAKCSLNMPFINGKPGTVSLLTFSMNYLTSINWGSLTGLLQSSQMGAQFAELLSAVLLLYLAVVFGVLNFVFVLLSAHKLKAKINTILCILSTACFALSAILYSVCISTVASTSIVFISGSLQYGIFVGIALFGLNVVLNTVVNKSFKKERNEKAL